VQQRVVGEQWIAWRAGTVGQPGMRACHSAGAVVSWLVWGEGNIRLSSQ
jgi:hypothetical protein